jgi:hypothetical protein
MMLRAWVGVIALLACGAAAAANFSVALLGDAPYSLDEEASFMEMLREINSEDVAFVVHVGDFKNGWTSCGDPVFAQRKEMFAASRHPLIYLPGDNEWTDCWRFLAGGYDPLERLARLREIFFSAPMSLGMQPLPLTRQSDAAAAHPYPEHVRWKHGNALFAGLNLPGGDNNLGRMPQEHAERDAAARDWLKQAFALAHRDKLGAIVVLFQANPFTESMRPRRGFAEFLDLLAHETMAFDGQVLLVHGDTHRYRVDRPLRHPDTREPLQNFTRIEVFGSPNVNWVRLQVVADGARVNFEVSPGH